ncbi:MAG TPA: hypothetical protein VH369_26025 [Bryobacteraceae bacterium]
MKILPAMAAALFVTLAFSLSNCATGDPTMHEISAITVPTPTPDPRSIPFGFRGGRRGY